MYIIQNPTTPQPSMIDFRKKLAKELIYNSYDEKDDDKTTRKVMVHGPLMDRLKSPNAIFEYFSDHRPVKAH